MTTEIPAIEVGVHEAVREEQLAEILLGMEEEGVPAHVWRDAELNPLNLAARAATASRLGVGVGIALDYAVITTDKLPQERPYIATHVFHDRSRDRIVGSNAARLVKRIPLRQERSQ